MENDYADDWSQVFAVSRERFHARRTAAYQAFYEHMPLRRRSVQQADGGMRIYDRLGWGDLAEFTLLDGRQYRSAQGCQRPNNRRTWTAPLTCPDVSDPTRTFLGFEQERWLYDGFGKSPARWNMLVQPIPFAPYLQKTADGGLGIYTDGWAAYGLSRQRLLDALKASGQKNTVVLTGDMHASLAADVTVNDKDPTSEVIAAELLTTSITSDNSPAFLAETLPQNPQIKMLNLKTHGYMSISVGRDRVETRYQAISDRLDPMASVRTDAVYHVAAGKAGVAAG